MSSMPHQVKRVLENIFVENMSEERIKAQDIPETRSEAKEEGKDKDYIYGRETFKTYLKQGSHFAKWCKKEYDINKLNQIDSKMVKAYYEKQKEEGKSSWTIKTRYSAISKLERAVVMMGWRSKHDDGFQISKEEADLPDRKIDERKSGGRYTKEEVGTILAGLKDYSKDVYNAAECQAELGLRIHEVENLKVEDIDYEEKEIRISEGKGGKERTIEIPSEYAEKLKELIKNKEDKERVFNIKKRNVQKAIKNITDKKEFEGRGTHGFRAYASYEMYKAAKKDGKTEKEALKKATKFLGHERISVVKRYYLTR